MARWMDLDGYIKDAAAAGGPPLSVTVAGKEGVLYCSGAAQDRPAPVYWLASMTKLVTAIAVLQLWEQGRVQWDEPVARWLPELAAPRILTGYRGEEPVLRAAQGEITLAQLMLHQSGLSYPIWNADLARYIGQQGIPMPGSGKIAALDLPLTFEPGTSWAYSIGLDWAGLLVERISGRRLDACFRESIFQPLGMVDTAFEVSADMQRRMVDLLAIEADGTHKVIERSFTPPETCMGGAGLYGSEADFSRLLMALLGQGVLGGQRILQPDSVALLLRPQIRGRDIGVMHSAMPAVSADVDLYPGQESGWALGGQVNLQLAHAMRSPGSVGWAGAANTYFWIDPQRQAVALVMMQMLPFANPLALRTLGAVEGLVCQALDARSG
ncbi:TPA: beta-lactamase family protein [Pseudomonas aeruginosa]|nr:beta-lactamase family protein [Pseudomonas aeruginosa]HCE9344668.1 beta-lactamase family protein [Pseudomonas aeruginosa]